MILSPCKSLLRGAERHACFVVLNGLHDHKLGSAITAFMPKSKTPRLRCSDFFSIGFSGLTLLYHWIYFGALFLSQPLSACLCHLSPRAKFSLLMLSISDSTSTCCCKSPCGSKVALCRSSFQPCTSSFLREKALLLAVLHSLHQNEILWSVLNSLSRSYNL